MNLMGLDWKYITTQMEWGMVSSKDYYKDDKFELYKTYNESGKLVKILVYDIVVGSQCE